MLFAQHLFLKYVRTKMVFTQRLKQSEEFLKPVHISTSEIESRFFPFPKYNRNKIMQDLHDAGELKITKKGCAYFYEALKPGGYDLNLLQPKRIIVDPLHKAMLANLKTASLPVNSISTPYFDLFLEYKEQKPELFFTVDTFCQRVHTPVSSFSKQNRSQLLISGEPTQSVDVVTMQPLLLGKTLTASIGDNQYSDWINEGVDIYVKLQQVAGLNSRDAAKTKFFEILFSKPSNELAQLFGYSAWINWINEYKQTPEPHNPHNKSKPHSNLAWLLQSTEVAVMRKIWETLFGADIPFLSVHDEIIVRQKDYIRAVSIFEKILSVEFQYFKLNGNKTIFPTNIDDAVVLVPESLDNSPATPPLLFDWWAEIENLQRYFNDYTYNGRPVLIDQCSRINDVKSFSSSHLEVLKRNEGNKTFMPYFDRLLQLRNHLEKVNKTI